MTKQILKIVASLVLVFIFCNQSMIPAKSETSPITDFNSMEEIEPRNTVPLSYHWLDRFNDYREATGLPLVTESPAYSADLAKHTNYMLLNLLTEGLWHGETPGRPGYTPEGDQAAAESNLFWFSSGAPYGTTAMALDAWMGSIHHRYGMLNPDLTITGFSMGCDNRNCGAGLNVIRGIVWGAHPKPNGVFYPGPEQKGVNTDIVLTWQFHREPAAIIQNALLHDSNGQAIPITTTSPSANEYFNVVSIKPVTPLAQGTNYAAHITVQLGERQLSQSWDFTRLFFQMCLLITGPGIS